MHFEFHPADVCLLKCLYDECSARSVEGAHTSAVDKCLIKIESRPFFATNVIPLNYSQGLKFSVLGTDFSPEDFIGVILT